MLSNILLVLHLVVALAIVTLVLLQQGKGSDMGAAFGGGSSQSLFGARGSANFLSRATSLLVTLFFLSSMTLAYIYTHQGESASVISELIGSPETESTSTDADEVPESPDEQNATETIEEPDVPATPQ